MKKTSVLLLLAGIGITLQISCKKNSNTLSPFAANLAKTCTKPFVGRGDSSNIYLPTAFTPNGDGMNDVYNVIGAYCSAPGYFSNFLFTIYDATGNLVYQSNQVEQSQWDGVDPATGKISTKYKFYVKIHYTTAGNITDSGGTFVYLLSTDSAKGCVNRVYADTANYEFSDQFNLAAGFTYRTLEHFCN